MKSALFFSLLVVACAHRPHAATSSTRYRVGDFVVYRYSGTSLPGPVTLRERIVQQVGNRLEIEVRAERGQEKRDWVQVVIDTPTNQREDRIEALYEVADGKRTLLANENGRDLLRLYEWVLLVPDGKSTEKMRVSAPFSLLGRPLACETSSGRNTVKGSAVRIETIECPDFLWTHAFGRFVAADGSELFRVEVTDWGPRPSTR